VKPTYHQRKSWASEQREAFKIGSLSPSRVVKLVAMGFRFEDKVIEHKSRLLEMARNGESRPRQRDGTIGIVLCNYTSSKSETYDPEFDREIRRLRPDWFRMASSDGVGSGKE
jgi:hypothetical protein